MSRMKILIITSIICFIYCSSCPTKCICPYVIETNCKNASYHHLSGGIDKRTEVLDFSFNKIQSLRKRAFFDVGLINIKVLLLQYNMISTIDESAFFHLEKLTFLNLSDNYLMTLGQYLFHNNNRLEILIINANNFNFQDNKPLLNSSSIRILEMRQCALDNIPYLSFKSLTGVEMIILSENILTHLHINMFRNKQNLRYVSLRNNYIKQIDKDTFNGIPNLELLDLSYNQIIDLNSLFLSRIDSLTNLYLSNNMLTMIKRDYFYNLTILKVLDLSRNLIRYIESGSFSDLRLLQELDLSENNLYSIEFGDFCINERLKFLRLPGNILPCSCNFTEFYKWTMLRNISLVPSCLDSNALVASVANFLSDINCNNSMMCLPPIEKPDEIFPSIYYISVIIITIASIICGISIIAVVIVVIKLLPNCWRFSGEVLINVPREPAVRYARNKHQARHSSDIFISNPIPLQMDHISSMYNSSETSYQNVSPIQGESCDNLYFPPGDIEVHNSSTIPRDESRSTMCHEYLDFSQYTSMDRSFLFPDNIPSNSNSEYYILDDIEGDSVNV